MIFPERVLGRLVTISIWAGTAMGPSYSFSFLLLLGPCYSRAKDQMVRRSLNTYIFYILIIISMPGCVRVGLSWNEDRGPSTKIDSSIGNDASKRDASGRDAPGADLTMAKHLSCSPATPAVNDSTEWLREPALSTNGLDLFACDKSVPYKMLSAHRPSFSEAYGDWQQSDILPKGLQDPTFFETTAGKQRALISVPISGVLGRGLKLCDLDPGSACSSITIINKITKEVLLHDVDGPNVTLIDDDLLMAFNVQPQGMLADIYLARPVPDTDLLSWECWPIIELSTPTFHEDDPALSADGRVLVFDAGHDGNSNLWYSLQDTSSMTFSTPAPLTQVNSDAFESGAALFDLPNGTLELYFHSNRSDDISKIYRSICELN